MSATLEQAFSRVLVIIGNEVANAAKEPEAPHDTGNLSRDIRVYPGFMKAEVGNSKLAPYAPFVYFGTGLYGPKKKRIVPRSKKALSWGKGKFFARSVRGMRPRPYLNLGLEAVIKSGKVDRLLAEHKAILGQALAYELGKQLKGVVGVRVG